VAETTYLHIVPGAVETGHWCETCQLPSAVEVELVVLGQTGVSGAGTARLCPDCTPDE